MNRSKNPFTNWFLSATLGCLGLALAHGACSSSSSGTHSHDNEDSGGSGGGDTGGAPATAGSGGSARGGGGGGGAGGGGAGGGGAGGGTSDAAAGGATGDGSTSSGDGGGGTDGGAGGTGGSSSAWKCPAGPFMGSPIPAGAKPTRIAGAPPADAFNMNAGFTNVEGPVWINDTLYFTEMTSAALPPARILAIGPNDAVSVFIATAGANGLAVDNDGNLLSANHGAQGIVRFALPSKAPTTLISMYMDKKFNSPNDLTVASDGTIYFTDPDWQNMTMHPQGGTGTGTRVYQLSPGATTAKVITDYLNEPNGITLSLDEKTLYVAGGSGVKKYAITNGMVAMTGTAFSPSLSSGTDGMGIDCAGNLYVAVPGTKEVQVFDPAGMKIGTITITDSPPSSVTNVAFGGTDHQTLYITGQGNVGQAGVFKVHLNFPGKPY